MQWSRDAYEYRQDAIRVTIAVFVFACVLKCIAPSNHAQPGTDNVIKTLITNGNQYYNMARQDQMPAYRLQHAAMAVANLETARQLFDDSTIERISGTDVHALLKSVEQSLNAAQKMGANNKGRKALPVWP